MSRSSATGESNVSLYQLRVLGGLSLEQAGRPVEDFASQRKALALMAVLACGGSRGVSRDRLMLLFWPESDVERARGSLKQLLHAIRKQLAQAEIIIGTAELRLNADAIESDVAMFRAALSDGDDTAAVRAYAGPLLDGVHIDGAEEFERWAADERGYLARTHAEALERIAIEAEAGGQFDQAMSSWRRVLDVDRLNGRVVVGLMRALVAAGDRAGALQQARTHEALLQHELGAPPDPEVARLAEEIQSGAYARPATAQAVLAPLASNVSQASDVSRAPLGGRAAGTRRWRWVAMLIVVALAATAGLAWRQRSTALNATLLPSRVAVALFANRTGTSALDHLGTMASDWVTQGLARTSLVDVFDIGGLYVQGRTASGVPTDPRALARANGAGLVVAGNYYKGTHDTLMFTAQVIDVATGKVLRSLAPVAGRTSEPLAGIEEVRQRVTVALRSILEPPGSLLATPALVPPRLDAYTEYAAGQELYWNGDWVGALPHLRQAASLDSTFNPALVFLSVIGVGTAQCTLVDSIHQVLVARGARVSEIDMIGARIQVARCASDHAEHNRLHRRRAALLPGSKFIQLTMSTGFRQMHQPAEALAILSNIDPSRDLGWLPERGRAFYWREVAAVRHALGDYRAELATSERMEAMEASPLGIVWFRARALAALGRGREALATVLLTGTPNEPALFSGIVGPLNAAHLASLGWVRYQTALELDAHGDSSRARAAAAAAIAWFDERGTGPSVPPSQRFAHAGALEFVGELGKARTTLETLVTADSARVDYRGALGVVAARLGDTAGIAAIDAWLAARPTRFPPGLPVLYRAKIAAVTGDTARALEFIDALPHGVHPLDFLQFHIDPAFRMLRGNERFQRMLVPRG